MERTVSPSIKEGPPPLTRKEIIEETKAETLRIPDEVSPERKQQVVDAVWGVQDEGGPNYKGLGWIRTSVILLKLQIGLGVLSIPCKSPVPACLPKPGPLRSAPG